MATKTPRPDEIVSGPQLPPVETTLGSMFRARAQRWPDRPAVRFRDRGGRWVDLTWARFDEKRRALAAGLRELGIGAGDIVAIVSENRAEMLLAEAAIVSMGAACAPVFPEYNHETLLGCVRDTRAKVVIAGSAANQHALRSGPLPTVEHVVVLDDAPEHGDARGTPLSKLLEAKPAGEENEGAGPDTVAYVLFTSGTTGRPKGVELTHRNVLSQQAALAATWDVGEQDVFLSYLPWHHCFGALFERMTALSRGSRYVLDDSRGKNLDRLLENVAQVKPTVYFSVPKVYQALIGRGRKDPRALEAFFHPGLRFVLTAAAPLAPSVYRFFEERRIPVLEGWGMTETSPVVTLTPQTDPHPSGIVGWPIPGTSVRVHDGEVQVRGPQVMKGYLRDPAATARVLRDGWLNTGDLGEWTADGLRIKARADGVFKLENGEKVVAGEVESRILGATPLVDLALVLAEGQPDVTALVWLSAGGARAWAEAHKFPAGSPEELASMPELRLAIGEALRSANLLAPAHHERVKRIALLREPPSIERGEITPTLKLVRAAVLQRHGDLVTALQGRGKDPRILELVRREE